MYFAILLKTTFKIASIKAYHNVSTQSLHGRQHKQSKCSRRAGKMHANWPWLLVLQIWSYNKCFCFCLLRKPLQIPLTLQLTLRATAFTQWRAVLHLFGILAAWAATSAGALDELSALGGHFRDGHPNWLPPVALSFNPWEFCRRGNILYCMLWWCPNSCLVYCPLCMLQKCILDLKKLFREKEVLTSFPLRSRRSPTVLHIAISKWSPPNMTTNLSSLYSAGHFHWMAFANTNKV